MPCVSRPENMRLGYEQAAGSIVMWVTRRRSWDQVFPLWDYASTVITGSRSQGCKQAQRKKPRNLTRDHALLVPLESCKNQEVHSTFDLKDSSLHIAAASYIRSHELWFCSVFVTRSN